MSVKDFFNSLLESLKSKIKILVWIIILIGALPLGIYIPLFGPGIAWAGGCLGTVMLARIYYRSRIKETVVNEKKVWGLNNDIEELKKQIEKDEQFYKEKMSTQGVVGFSFKPQICFFEITKSLIDLEERENKLLDIENQGNIFTNTIDNFKRKVSGNNSKTTTKYKGKMSAHYIEQIGIDLKQIKIAFKNGIFSVSGIKPTRIGIKDIQQKWEVCQITRTINVTNDKGNQTRSPRTEVLEAHDQLKDEMKEDIRLLQEKINNNNFESDYSDFIKMMARSYISILLRTFRECKDVKFIDKEEKNSIPLLDYLMNPDNNTIEN